MASTILPLAIPAAKVLLPLLKPAIKKAIVAAEGLFSRKPKSGPEKTASVEQFIRMALAAQADPASDQPTDSELQTLVAGLVAELKAGGELTVPDTVPGPASDVTVSDFGTVTVIVIRK